MFNSGYETSLSALELASALVAIHLKEVKEEFLTVILTSLNKPSKTVEVSLASAIKLANGGEILHCVTPQGKKVDFIISSPIEDRDDGFITAIALIEDGV